MEKAATTTGPQTQTHLDPVQTVDPNGRTKRVGYKAVCPGCSWESHRYDQRSTVELIYSSHQQRCHATVSSKKAG